MEIGTEVLAHLPDDVMLTLTVSQLRELLRAEPQDETLRDRLAPLTVSEVAEEVGRAESTVRGWLASGDLEGFHSGREWRVWPEAVAEYFSRQEEAHRARSSAGPDPERIDLGAWRKHIED